MAKKKQGKQNSSKGKKTTVGKKVTKQQKKQQQSKRQAKRLARSFAKKLGVSEVSNGTSATAAAIDPARSSSRTGGNGSSMPLSPHHPTGQAQSDDVVPIATATQQQTRLRHERHLRQLQQRRGRRPRRIVVAMEEEEDTTQPVGSAGCSEQAEFYKRQASLQEQHQVMEWKRNSTRRSSQSRKQQGHKASVTLFDQLTPARFAPPTDYEKTLKGVSQVTFGTNGARDTTHDSNNNNNASLWAAQTAVSSLEQALSTPGASLRTSSPLPLQQSASLPPPPPPTPTVNTTHEYHSSSRITGLNPFAALEEQDESLNNHKPDVKHTFSFQPPSFQVVTAQPNLATPDDDLDDL